MAKTRAQKKEQIEKLSDRLSRAKGVAFVTFSAVKVGQIDELRKSLRQSNTSLQVSKKNLLRVAAKENNLELPVDTFVGEVAALFSMDDEVGAAKQAAAAGKKLEQWKVVGGVLEGKYIDAAQTMVLAKLPGKPELLAQTLRVFQGPVSGFVNVLAANLRGLVQVLQAAADAKK